MKLKIFKNSDLIFVIFQGSVVVSICNGWFTTALPLQLAHQYFVSFKLNLHLPKPDVFATSALNGQEGLSSSTKYMSTVTMHLTFGRRASNIFWACKSYQTAEAPSPRHKDSFCLTLPVFFWSEIGKVCTQIFKTIVTFYWIKYKKKFHIAKSESLIHFRMWVGFVTEFTLPQDH